MTAGECYTVINVNHCGTWSTGPVSREQILRGAGREQGTFDRLGPWAFYLVLTSYGSRVPLRVKSAPAAAIEM